ncbi:MAG: extracellular solute-binding protein [Eubacterium sp.]|nr:extracellular solute-binding protein [Eubacterium sp.]
MKLKKVAALLLAGTMAFSVTACGGKADDAASTDTSTTSTSSSDTASDNDDTASADTASSDEKTGTGEKLVVWTLAVDLEQFGERYSEQTGTEVETVVIAPDDYATKVQTALMGGEKEPDIIVGEPQMLEDMYDNGFFADLNEFGAQDYADQVVDYVWKVGQDKDGIQRTISYQITPAGIYYRRDIAKEVFGTDDPAEVGKLFADYPTILTTAQTLKDAGYRIFASDAEMNYFTGDTAWVVDGKLNVAQARLDYMDLAVELYQKDLTAYANQWSTPWYQGMAGEVPILTADIQNYADDSVNVWDAEQFADSTKDMDKTQIFAYGLPSWGVITLRDNVKDTSGSWGVCSGPAYGFGGGTYIGISANSEKKELAWDYVKFCTLNEDTANWWIEASQGDTVALKSVLEQHKDDENAIYGGQKLYSFWQEQAAGIDYSKVTRYDKVIGDAWGQAISSIKTGQSNKEDAINGFYDVVQSTYPEIEIDR